ncbi:MAG: prepilin peptidase [Clostridia bacterium]|nr:prepilin peptidase [Clostridia bacterium]
MYFNDVNIGYYIVVAILGLFVGELVNWTNKRLPEYKKIFSVQSFKEYKSTFNPNYVLMILTSVIYVVLLYKFGISDKLIENLNLIKYLILTPFLLSTFVIDYHHQIIPNRLVLTMFEIGLVFTFIYGLSNVAISLNMLLGMLAGGGIFLAITLLGGLVYGKEAMGLGDVKFMGALGLYFGLANIIIIALISFLVGAILSIILLVTRIKKTDEYIPFGPFIVIATFIVIIVPYELITTVLFNIFTLGLYSRRVR